MIVDVFENELFFSWVQPEVVTIIRTDATASRQGFAPERMVEQNSKLALTLAPVKECSKLLLAFGGWNRL